MSLSKGAILEITDLSAEAEGLVKGSQSDRARATVLLQRISTIKEVGLSSDECRGLYAEALGDELGATRKSVAAEDRRKVEAYLAGRVRDQELRDFLAGAQSVSYTQGAADGLFGPPEDGGTVRHACGRRHPRRR